MFIFVAMYGIISLESTNDFCRNYLVMSLCYIFEIHLLLQNAKRIVWSFGCTHPLEILLVKVVDVVHRPLRKNYSGLSTDFS